MVTYYKLDKNAVMSEEEKAEIKNARLKPIVYDEDSPELTESMKKAFMEARRKKPYKGRSITLVVSDLTIEKAEKMFGDEYSLALGKLLDKAVNEYSY